MSTHRYGRAHQFPFYDDPVDGISQKEE